MAYRPNSYMYPPRPAYTAPRYPAWSPWIPRPRPPPPAPYRRPIAPIVPLDEFAEFFSTLEDGTTPIPKTLGSGSTPGEQQQQQCATTNPKVPKGTLNRDSKYLPFDELIGYKFPEEAAEGLGILFQGRKEPGPLYETTMHTLAELRLNSGEVFQAVGKTKSEAENKAARKALEYLRKLKKS